MSHFTNKGGEKKTIMIPRLHTGISIIYAKTSSVSNKCLSNIPHTFPEGKKKYFLPPPLAGPLGLFIVADKVKESAAVESGHT